MKHRLNIAAIALSASLAVGCGNIVVPVFDDPTTNTEPQQQVEEDAGAQEADAQPPQEEDAGQVPDVETGADAAADSGPDTATEDDATVQQDSAAGQDTSADEDTAVEQDTAVEEDAGQAVECVLNADCASKEDGDLCNGTLVCTNGQCVIDTTTIVYCPNDSDSCVMNSCNSDTGQCESIIKLDGTACEDGDACTNGDSCEAGACVGQALSCDDGNPCTADVCDPLSGCIYANLDGSTCDDGNSCTTSDTCSGGTCAGIAEGCDDGNACTTDSCDPVSGECVHTAISCDDGNACTTDSCDPATGACTNTTLSCDDGVSCTEDTCDTATGCVNTPQATACDDGVSCTTDSCDPAAGGCINTVDPANGAVEVCDGLDNDCNGDVDDGLDGVCMVVTSNEGGSDVDLADGWCGDAEGNCTLRAATETISGLELGAMATIYLPAGTYHAGSMPFMMAMADGSVTLRGESKETVILEAQDSGSAMHLLPNINVTLEQLTIQNATNSAIIVDDANLTLIQVRMANNNASDKGGAIQANAVATNVSIEVSDSTLEANTAAQGGGAIHVHPLMANTGINVTISNSTLSSNQAPGASGGAFHADAGTSGGVVDLTIIDSTLTNNSASHGGGIVFNTSDMGGELSILNSRLTNNAANSNSGAMAVGGNVGILTIDRTRFHDNIANRGSALNFTPGQSWTANISNSSVDDIFSHQGALAVGGSGTADMDIHNTTFANTDVTQGVLWLMNPNLDLHLTHVTIVNNGNSGAMSGIHMDGGMVTMVNSIVANNGTEEQRDIMVTSGTFNSVGGNVIGVIPGGVTFAANDVVGSLSAPIDPQLGGLVDDGNGPVFYEPSGSSPALDLGILTPMPSDQRGCERGIDGDGDGQSQPDAGAIEHGGCPQ